MLVPRILAIIDVHLPANQISHTFWRASRVHTQSRASLPVPRSGVGPCPHARLGRVLCRRFPPLRTPTPATSLRKCGRTLCNFCHTKTSPPWPAFPAMYYHTQGRPCTKASTSNPCPRMQRACAPSLWHHIQSWPCSCERSNHLSSLHSLTCKVHCPHSPSHSLFLT